MPRATGQNVVSKIQTTSTSPELRPSINKKKKSKAYARFSVKSISKAYTTNATLTYFEKRNRENLVADDYTRLWREAVRWLWVEPDAEKRGNCVNVS